MAEIGEPEKRVVVVPLENPVVQPTHEPSPLEPVKVPEKEPAQP
jgi:hypothetical protein